MMIKIYSLLTDLDTLQKYNLFVLKELYDYVDTDFCLVINWDSWVCNPKHGQTNF